jgi:hypothetical protein
MHGRGWRPQNQIYCLLSWLLSELRDDLSLYSGPNIMRPGLLLVIYAIEPHDIAVEVFLLGVKSLLSLTKVQAT